MMISVEDAFKRIVETTKPLTTEKIVLEKASGRVLAAPLTARRTQPGADMSAMDGYAVKSSSLTGKPTTLKLIGESAAGSPFPSACGDGEAVRIFTGGIVPEGADQVVVQEDCTAEADSVTTAIGPEAGRHIRLAGIDFAVKQIVLDQGTYISPKSIGLAASAGYDHLMVHRAPKVAILATGDELVPPGKKDFEPFETVNSTAPQISALLSDAGAEVTILGQTGDDLKALKAAVKKAAGADILITIGGASVGDKDFMQQALASEGMALDFWKVAMRPGKPLIFGTMGQTKVIGLPGNPVSAFVCALLFARPLVDQMMGRPAPLPAGVPLPLATDLAENGPRQHYMRARLVGEPGSRHLDPAIAQDSSLVSVLAQCDGLIVREPNAPVAKVGTMVPFLPF
ncbi:MULTISPECIES: gephyrin-like molybdotransferase Glp [Kordiimonas]|jgi:molybdopterin molybdotransferase|uniref:molybdopterin molybdotransferase MoeA n=1 Tax=Kordiimonas TaxID=288021 RepID=UPI0025803DDC|nr:gephyrin-like molybdotransferase Glp [Kordiimonas sp. UBA4487]